MKSKILSIFALILILLSFTFVSAQLGQSSESEANEIMLNLASSPLKMFLSTSKRGYSLVNYSSERIVKYRLGCVLQESSKFKVVSKRPYQETNLNPIDKTTGQSTGLLFGSSHYFPEELCKGKARLAVIEVGFADGATWRAK